MVNENEGNATREPKWWRYGDGVRAYRILCQFAEQGGIGEYVVTLRDIKTGEEVDGVIEVAGDPPRARIKFWP